MRERKAIALDVSNRVKKHEDRNNPLGKVYIAFVVLLVMLFIKLLMLLVLQQTTWGEGATMVVDTSSAGFFWLVMSICVFPVVGVSLLLYWMASGFREEAELLSRQEQHVLRSGKLALAEVVAQDGPELTLRHIDAKGKARTSRMELYDTNLLQTYPIGSELSVLVDPKRPERALSPQLLGVEFNSLQRIEDVRPRYLSNTPDEALSPTSAPHVMRLEHREPPRRIVRARTLRERVRDSVARLLRGRRRSALVLDGARLLAVGLDADDPDPNATRTYRLDQPFAVDLSVWLMSARKARLHVTLQPEGAASDARPLRFSVVVPQAHLSAALPMLESTAPELSLEDFERLWASLQYYARTHSGDPLRGLVEFHEAHAEAPEPARRLIGQAATSPRPSSVGAV